MMSEAKLAVYEWIEVYPGRSCCFHLLPGTRCETYAKGELILEHDGKRASIGQYCIEHLHLLQDGLQLGAVL